MNGWQRPDRDTSGQAEPAHSARKGAVAGEGPATTQVAGLGPGVHHHLPVNSRKLYGTNRAFALPVLQALRRRIRPEPLSATPTNASKSGSDTDATGKVSNITSGIAAAWPP